MTPLHRLIRDEIEIAGPMTIARFMSLCLSHPEHGYYVTRDPLGQSGDFTTAPEISQMFGEMIGAWIAQTWMDQGAPKGHLVELGPGRGTLMADILRVGANVPGFREALAVTLVETSPALRRAQEAVITNAAWVDSIDDLPEGPVFLVANEFFDALPVHQFQRIDEIWMERCVKTTETGFAPVLKRLDDLPPAPLPVSDSDGTIRELAPLRAKIAAKIGERLTKDGGAALILDYGSEGGVGDTLQALRDHKPSSPFDAPGETDLTTHVDFAAMAEAAKPARASPLATQGAFLAGLGIGRRAEVLAKEAPETTAAALHRLTHETEMGTLFKVLGLTHPDAPPLPGLDI